MFFARVISNKNDAVGRVKPIKLHDAFEILNGLIGNAGDSAAFDPFGNAGLFSGFLKITRVS